MAITQFDVVGSAWTAITSAGQSGTCWLKPDATRGVIALFHSDSGVPSDDDLDSAYQMLDNKHNIVSIVADNASDVFYARCTNDEDTEPLIVDVV